MMLYQLGLVWTENLEKFFRELQKFKRTLEKIVGTSGRLHQPYGFFIVVLQIQVLLLVQASACTLISSSVRLNKHPNA
jgi:hypothetical protein